MRDYSIIIDNQVQSLFESAIFSNVKLEYMEIKQVTGEPVTSIYIPIDVLDEQSQRHPTAITISRDDESKPWIVKCPYLSNSEELAHQWNDGWNEAIWEMVDEVFPTNSQA